MQNKLTLLIASVYLLALPPPLYADPLDKNEFKAMVYVSFPLGGFSTRQEAPTLGLAVRHTLTDYYRELGDDKTGSLVDMRFNLREKNLNTFRIGGMNALAIPSRLNADGASETTAEMSESAKVAMVATGLGILGLLAFVHHETKQNIDLVLSTLPGIKPKQ